MKFSIITAFPGAYSYLDESIPKRAKEKGIVEIGLVNLLDFGVGKWNKIDDRPYGGGEGMVISVEPVYKALKSIGVYPDRDEETKVLITTPGGELWSQARAEEYTSSLEHIVIICGHYEGVDQRVVDEFVDGEVSIGDYVLSGGELASMVIMDSIIRLMPGVLGNEDSFIHETTFGKGVVDKEAPVYTRPEIFKTEEGKELEVPDTLLSGNHQKIEEWKTSNREQLQR